jgi:hypothetical protein
MMTTEELLTLIESRRAELGLSQVDVGRRAFGKADNSVISNMKRGSSPTFDRLTAICDALGLELHVGLPRKSGFSDSDTATSLAPADAFRSNYLPIPWQFPLKASGSSPVAVSHEWLTKVGIVPDRLKAVMPDDVDLDGYEAERVVAIIESGSKRRDTIGIWCFQEGDHVKLARAQFGKGFTLVFGKTTLDQARLIEDGDRNKMKMLGRVVWMDAISPR